MGTFVLCAVCGARAELIGGDFLAPPGWLWLDVTYWPLGIEAGTGRLRICVPYGFKVKTSGLRVLPDAAQG